MSKNHDILRRIVQDAIDRALSVLGENGKRALYFHLENSFGVRRSEIPDKPEIFSQALRTIFGPGSAILEQSIVRELSESEGLQLTSTNFVDAVKLLRQLYQRQ